MDYKAPAPYHALDANTRGFVLMYCRLQATIAGLLVGLVGCTNSHQGAIQSCSTSLPGYERGDRLPASPLTLVDTPTSLTTGRGTSTCCADPALVDSVQFDSIYIPQLPTDAARHGWTPLCTDDACDTCNLCPYGVAEFQGTWGDLPMQNPAHTRAVAGDISNRVDIDGNTFRWRAVNRRTGSRAEYRGYYYCPQPGVHVVQSTWSRTWQGPTCPLRYENEDGYQNPDEPWPTLSQGDGIRVGMWSMYGPLTGESGIVWQTLSIVAGRELERFQTDPSSYDIAVGRTTMCRPGSRFGTAPASVESQQLIDCPDDDEFFGCWTQAE